MDPGSPESGLIEVLRRAGLEIRSGGLRDLVLALPDRRVRSVDLKIFNRVPQVEPVVDRLQGRPTLVALPQVSPSWRKAALEGRVDVVGLMDGVVVAGAVDFSPTTPVAAAGTKSKHVGRPAWTRWALERLMILQGPNSRQVEIAAQLGVTPQAVSSVWRRHSSLAEHREGAWGPRQREELLTRNLAEYRGPGKLRFFWYGLDPLPEQLAQAMQLGRDLEIEVAVGGDFAVDRFSPWRIPSRAEIYAPEAIDLTVLGFSPAPAGGESLILIVPDDPTLLKTAVKRDASRTVDPVIALWELMRRNDPDAPEAAEVLRSSILNGEWNNRD